jgi:hypothetical protein
MTLVLTIQGREAIWLLADRRLSFRRQVPRDDARKIMVLNTIDAVAIMGYAGLGMTAAGTEPSDWMTRVLRGRSLTFEHSLNELARAAEKQLPRHLKKIERGFGSARHAVVVTAFVGGEARCYSIDVGLGLGGEPIGRYRRYRQESGGCPRVAVFGSGQSYLQRDLSWRRPLLNWVRYYDRRMVGALVVADKLARLNEEVHLADGMVGPRCIVVWRNREGAVRGAGGHQFYNAGERELESGLLPGISRGMDVNALLKVMIPDAHRALSNMLKGKPAIEDLDEVNRQAARLEMGPDEQLE